MTREVNPSSGSQPAKIPAPSTNNSNLTQVSVPDGALTRAHKASPLTPDRVKVMDTKSAKSIAPLNTPTGSGSSLAGRVKPSMTG